MCLRLENLKRIQTGSWDKLKAGDFKPDKARRALGLLRSDRRHSAWPVRYLLLAKAAFEMGELSENQLAKKFRTDIVSTFARIHPEELDSLVVSEEGEEFLCHSGRFGVAGLQRTRIILAWRHHNYPRCAVF